MHQRRCCRVGCLQSEPPAVREACWWPSGQTQTSSALPAELPGPAFPSGVGLRRDRRARLTVSAVPECLRLEQWPGDRTSPSRDKMPCLPPLGFFSSLLRKHTVVPFEVLCTEDRPVFLVVNSERFTLGAGCGLTAGRGGGSGPGLSSLRGRLRLS